MDSSGFRKFLGLVKFTFGSERVEATDTLLWTDLRDVFVDRTGQQYSCQDSCNAQSSACGNCSGGNEESTPGQSNKYDLRYVN